MAESDIETLRQGFERYNQGEFDAVVQLLDDDFEMEVPTGEPIRGKEAVRRFWEPDAFEWQRFEPLSMEQLGDKILMHVHARARGAATGLEVDQRGWQVWTLRERRALRVQIFAEEHEARAAAGAR